MRDDLSDCCAADFTSDLGPSISFSFSISGSCSGSTSLPSKGYEIKAATVIKLKSMIPMTLIMSGTLDTTSDPGAYRIS